MRVAFHNLGCKVNSYELDIVRQQFLEAGYEEVPFNQEADVYIVNTCSVTNIADRKSRQMLHRAKRENPAAVVIAMGCYVETAKDVLSDGAVDLAVGNKDKKNTLAILRAYEKSAVEAGSTGETASGAVLLKHAGRTRADIKIQDGCNQFCTYCIIPYARGRIESRPQDEILSEIRQIAADGIREVVLSGIHISSYGRDEGRQGREACGIHRRRIDRHPRDHHRRGGACFHQKQRNGYTAANGTGHETQSQRAAPAVYPACSAGYGPWHGASSGFGASLRRPFCGRLCLWRGRL